MVVGVLQVELTLGEARNLKDKRRVVQSLKDRLHRDNAVAVAEVDRLDAHRVAVLGIVSVSNSGDRTRRVLDAIVERLRHIPSVELSAHHLEILTGH